LHCNDTKCDREYGDIDKRKCDDEHGFVDMY